MTAKTAAERAAKSRMKRASMGIDEVRVMVPEGVKAAVMALAERHGMDVKEVIQTAIINCHSIHPAQIDGELTAEIRVDVAPGIAKMLADKFDGDQSDAIRCLCVTLANAEKRDAEDLLQVPRHEYRPASRVISAIRRYAEMAE